MAYTGFLTRVTIWDDVVLDVTDPDVRFAMLEDPGEDLGNNIVDFYGAPAVWNAGTNQGSGGDFTMFGEVDIGVRFLIGTLYVDPDLFHGGVVTPGPVTITGTLFVDPDLFHGGVVIPEGQTITGTLFVDPDLFHGGVITSGGITITGTLYVDPDLFHGGAVVPGAITITGTLFVDPDLFHGGIISIDAGEQFLVGTLYVDPDLFHGGVVTPGTVTITGTLFVDPDLFHGGVISLDAGQTPEEAIIAILDTTTDAYWMWPRDSATVFQNTPGTIPAFDTDPVREVTNEYTGGLQDITEAIAPSDAARGVLSISGPDAHIRIDKADDRYVITAPAGGWDGTLFYGMNDVTMTARSFIPAGDTVFPERTGDSGPGNQIFGLIYTDGILSAGDALIIENAMIEAGSGSRNIADNGVTDMNTWFRDDFSILSVDLEHWDVSNVTVMNNLFRNAINVTDISTASWVTSSAEQLARVFGFCNSLTSIDVGNFDVSNVISVNLMFTDCLSLTSLDISNWVFGAALTNGTGLIFNCSSLTTLTVGNAFNAAVNCTTYVTAFENCALDVTSVNAILVSIEAAGSSGGILDINGGTNAAPTGAGATAVTDLQGRGWTVTTN